MSAPSPRERRAHELLDALLDLPPAERRARADAACGDDAELRALLDRLLAGAEDPTEPEWAAARRRRFDALVAPEESPALEPGARVGSWRVVAEIGRGGMARVYRAERVEGGFRQVAALKLLADYLASGATVRRFEQERQILATLAHPHIARLLDGGRAESGAPYLALEHVDGEPIDRFAEGRRLALRERLRLIVAVARAVQYAHAHLVVHRDLKPSNVFVGADGAPKLLDFGIAKVLDPSAAVLGDQGPAPPTRTHLRVLTPAWASPEQVRGGPIGTASDVYQLGLLLYRLIAGRDAHELRDSSWSELERVVCTIDPPPLRDATGERTAGGTRGPRGARTGSAVPADLDRIVRRTLAKEPERRYGSAAELADDLERFLADLPVRARPDTAGYRLRKFVRRHRLAVGAATLVVAVLVAATIGLSLAARRLAVERDRARLEEAKAREVSRFLGGLFDLADPEDTGGRELTAREILDRGAARLERDLAGQPELLAEMLGRVAGLYLQLARYEEAERLAARSRGIAERLEPPAEETAASAAHLLGWASSRRGRLAEAEARYEDALRRREALLGPDAPDTIESLAGRAGVRYERGDLEAARRDAEEVVARRTRSAGSSSWRVANDFDLLGLILLDQGDTERAEAAMREAHRVLASEIAAGDPRVAFVLNNLARVLEARARVDEAERLYRRSLEMKLALYGETDPSVGVALHNLARLEHRRGDLAAARASGERALAIRRAALGPAHPEVALTLFNLGLVERDDGRGALAAERLAAAVEIQGATLGADDARTLASVLQGAFVLLDADRLAEAEAAGAAAATAERGAIGRAPGLHAAHFLGRIACARGERERGLELLDEARRARLERRGADDRLTLESDLELALCRFGLEPAEPAAASLRAAAARLAGSVPRLRRRAAEALAALAAR